MKNCKIKIMIVVLFTAAATFLLTKEFSPEFEVVSKKSDTTFVTRVTTDEIENTFTTEQVGNIKRVLIDSLQNIYKNKINRLMADGKWKMENVESKDSSIVTEYVYVSKMDTIFVAHDENDQVTDSLHITSTFFSPYILSNNSLHWLQIKHKSFNKTIEKERTITTTELIEKEKTFWDRFHVGPNVSVGIGLINKQFDFYVGIGINYEMEF